MSDSLKKKHKRQEIIDGFHQLYLQNIAAETQKNGKLRGISGERLKEIFNDTIADYFEQLLVDAGC